MSAVLMFGRLIGDGHPTLVVSEIGLNHNGDLALAKELATVSFENGADVCKLQKRDAEYSTPAHRRDVMRDSCTAPVGTQITELEHRRRIELSADAYADFDAHVTSQGGTWFASAWDIPSVEFLEDFEVPAYKIASASVTDVELLDVVASTGKPVIASTGMSTLEEVDEMVERLGTGKLVLMHTCSAYPAENSDCNLRVMETLRKRYGVPIGWSGHERGIQVSVAAVALGACVVERHVTLDRTMRGSDHAASLEPPGLLRMVRDIRVVEEAMGTFEKRVLTSELGPREKLRRRV